MCAKLSAIFFTQMMSESWKKTFIILISKKSNLVDINDYRPISLSNTIYKIAIKILANRLKLLLPTMIAKEQGALIKDII